jgi:hypothetical protein
MRLLCGIDLHCNNSVVAVLDDILATTLTEMKEMYNAPMIGRNDVYWVSMETFYSIKPKSIK